MTSSLTGRSRPRPRDSSPGNNGFARGLVECCLAFDRLDLAAHEFDLLVSIMFSVGSTAPFEPGEDQATKGNCRCGYAQRQGGAHGVSV